MNSNKSILTLENRPSSAATYIRLIPLGTSTTTTTLLVLLCLLSLISHSRSDSSGSDHGLFPASDRVGYPGPTSVGSEPALIRSASQPILTDHYPVIEPSSLSLQFDHPANSSSSSFELIKSWANLSPAFSLPTQTFGIKSNPAIPPHCSLQEVHLLHRHGARYPTTGQELPHFGSKIKAAQINGTFQARGPLQFLNNWTYQLGSEVLTPLGRSQMFRLGIEYRQKYGYLLSQIKQEQKHQKNKLVFRTTSQDRMYKSSLNFAAGFFGIPYEEEYHQSILIEASGFNNSLAPYELCPSFNNRNNQSETGSSDSESGNRLSKIWQSKYLNPAKKRINKLVSGYRFSISDLFTMQNLCSYETVAFGTSQFCELFTEEEWKDYSYAIDLIFWHSFSFGTRFSPALGLGYLEELLARLSKTQPTRAMSSTNLTLNKDPRTFPIDQPIYVDATHDTVISAIVVALNFTFLAQSGPLPTTHRLEPRSFRVEQISPFGAHLTAQVMSCKNPTKTSDDSQKYIRFVMNDAIVPLNGLKDCQENYEDGLCELKGFIKSLENRINQIDYQKTCFE